jgi:hypothetical protein
MTCTDAFLAYKHDYLSAGRDVTQLMTVRDFVSQLAYSMIFRVSEYVGGRAT